MANEDKIYIVFVRRRSGVYTTWFECQVQAIGYKGNVYKSYKTHREAVLAWVMYEPRRKKPDAPIESAEYVEGNQVIGQLVDDQVLKKTVDRKQFSYFFCPRMCCNIHDYVFRSKVLLDMLKCGDTKQHVVLILHVLNAMVF